MESSKFILYLKQKFKVFSNKCLRIMFFQSIFEILINYKTIIISKYLLFHLAFFYVQHKSSISSDGYTYSMALSILFVYAIK